MNEMRKLMETMNTLFESVLDPVANRDRYTLVQTGTETDKGDPDEYEYDVTINYYDIMLDGKVVGEIETDDYFGYIHGKLHNKDLPRLDSYDTRTPEEDLKRFLSSKTGAKWAANIEKYADAKYSNDYRLK